ncbi:MAG TPA: hypothetical protein VHO03_18890 [Ignavibacteriales bacterium]|nr:hypothetical protein [Ignavibacteriales bacterium]
MEDLRLKPRVFYYVPHDLKVVAIQVVAIQGEAIQGEAIQGEAIIYALESFKN